MKRNLYRNLLWIVFLAGAMACGGEKKKSEKKSERVRRRVL